MLGRMNASMRFLVWGTIPIGSLIGAGLSELIGVQETIWISAILGLFAFLPVLISKVPRIRDDPDRRARAERRLDLPVEHGTRTPRSLATSIARS